MVELTTIVSLRAWVRERREARQRIGLVPTMGYLHAGHLALVDEARRRADVVVLSSFVNPLQFGAGEDYDRYPRDHQRDRTLAQERGVDAVFLPAAATMYPPGSEVRVVPGSGADRWEGAVRPGHFAGVLTVVAKLFNLVQPDITCFGQKDIQQVTLIRQMVRDLNWPVEVVVVPTVREPDGLALSSRNVYLSPDERRRALALSGALRAAHAAWRAGESSAAALEETMRTHLRTHLAIRARESIDYICLVAPDTLESVAVADGDTVVAVAARVGGTRLIDNIILGQGVAECSATS